MTKATRIGKIGNDIKIMKEFLEEFNPFYNKEELKDMTYWELVAVVKKTAKML